MHYTYETSDVCNQMDGNVPVEIGKKKSYSSLLNIVVGRVQALQVSVSFDHDSFTKSRARRELGIEDFLHLFKRSTARLNTENEPKGSVNDIEAHKDEIVSPINLLESNGGDVGVVEIGTV